MDVRPVIHVILGKHLGEGEYIVRIGDPLTLEQAEGFVALGWEVILDPSDMEALTRWEQIQRSQRKPKTWRSWPLGD